MSRTPSKEVRKQLRKEVGYGCPVPGCGNPYLRWHHFDPPWHEWKHHNTQGMIALCGEHHSKADAGAYTKEQLKNFKRIGTDQEIRGRFDWMRRDILAIVGGGFFYETPVVVEIMKKPVIWFNRDEEGYLLLNINMLSTSGQPRLVLEDNYWFLKGEPEDLVCPPSGKMIEASYPNGDYLKVEFIEIHSAADLVVQYKNARPYNWSISFPITVVEIHNTIMGLDIKFGPQKTITPSKNIYEGNFSSKSPIGFTIG